MNENRKLIGGLDYHIGLLEEMIIYPILFPQIFERLSLEPPKGILLKGPPGTGKTHLVRIVCQNYGIKMISVDCTKITGVYLGETEGKLRKIFQKATQYSSENGNAPCVIFIDEIDTLCPLRSSATQTETRVVGQFLTLLDGMTSRGNIIVVAATNRPNQIDPALRRPGRFDREIELPVPNQKQRLEILKIYTSGLPIDPERINEILLTVSEEITGYVGANIQSLCRDAAFLAFNRLKDYSSDTGRYIELEDFKEGIKLNPPSILKGEHYISSDVSHITWDDIGGLEDVKQQLKQAIEWPTLHKESFQRFGLQPPKGILLYGPPGCSKTTLVKAIANSSKLSFLSLSGAMVYSPYLGDSESTIRDIFKKARQSTPSIIFFDEIDAIVSKRNESSGGGDNAQSRVLSTFLNEMDGVEQLKGVIVVGATNRLDMIDPALLRPGRFDKIVQINLPDQDTRYQILKVKTKLIPLSNCVDLIEISKLTNGFSGADIENLCREASFQALRRDLFNI
eukprot:gene7682-9450_t